MFINEKTVQGEGTVIVDWHYRRWYFHFGLKNQN